MSADSVKRYEPELGPTEEPTVWMSECDSDTYVLASDYDRLAAQLRACEELKERSDAQLAAVTNERELWKNTATAAQAETEKVRADLNEVWVDDKGTAWTRPTAWAYAQVCRVKDEKESQLAASEKERDKWEREAGLQKEGALREMKIARSYRSDLTRVEAQLTTSLTAQAQAEELHKEHIQEMLEACRAREDRDGRLIFHYQSKLAQAEGRVTGKVRQVGYETLDELCSNFCDVVNERIELRDRLAAMSEALKALVAAITAPNDTMRIFAKWVDEYPGGIREEQLTMVRTAILHAHALTDGGREEPKTGG